MSPDLLQDALAFMATLAAAAWLLHRAWKRRHAAGPCAGCDGCPMASGSAIAGGIPASTLIPLDSLERSSALSAGPRPGR